MGKSIEEQCRRICLGQEPPIDPDRLAAPGKFNPCGNFTNWQVYEYMGMGNPLPELSKPYDPEKKKRQAYIARMIEETNPKPQKKFEYHTQNY